MSFKESNPAKMHLIQFTIVQSFILLLYLFILLSLFLGLMSILSDNGEFLIGFFMFVYLGSCMGPYLLIYIIVVFSLALWRRGVYGEEHKKSSIIAFFLGILGLVIPPALMVMVLAFISVYEKVYIVIPFFAYLVPAFLVIGMYFFVKDIGGRNKGAVGLIIYLISTLCVVLLFTVLLMGEMDWSRVLITIILLFAIFFTIFNMIGLVLLLMGYIDAFKWTNANKPLIDTQQKQQMEMQQYQVQMQQRTLELQREQIDMQMEQLKMLSEVRQEVLENGNPLIEPELNEARYDKRFRY